MTTHDEAILALMKGDLVTTTTYNESLPKGSADWVATYRHNYVDENGGQVGVSLRDNKPETIAAAEAMIAKASAEIGRFYALPLSEQYAKHLNDADKAFRKILDVRQTDVRDWLELRKDKDAYITELERQNSEMWGIADMACVGIPSEVTDTGIERDRKRREKLNA